MIPTDKQKQWLWEQCGWEYDSEFDYWYPPGSPKVRGFYITYRSFEMDIDLNNMFKYAVDWNEVETIQFSYGDDGHHCWLYMKKPVGKPFWGNGLTDEDALFWAISKALGGKE